jgi:pimeloyl-ACP methyl ester carboxylesterase
MRERASGFAAINGARIYFETAGEGPPFVMIHAGVADHRQWNNEFEYFAARFRVVRFDMRGYGKSEPVAGDFSHLRDLAALLAYLQIDEPLVLMGCSMGGGIAMDFALTHPARVRALIMVGSGPSGLTLDIPRPEGADEVEAALEAANKAGDLDRVAEIETQIWFDGIGRTAAQVNQATRKLAYEMCRNVAALEAKQLGKRLPDADVPAAKRLDALHIPVLVIVGEHDLPYLLAAADYMSQHIASAQKVLMHDAAHLPNMDHPETFRLNVDEFLSRGSME